MEETRDCENCYYMAFDEKTYPCSRCIRNAPQEDMWMPQNKPTTDCGWGEPKE